MKHRLLKRFILWTHNHGALTVRLVEFLFAKIRGVKNA